MRTYIYSAVAAGVMVGISIGFILGLTRGSVVVAPELPPAPIESEATTTPPSTGATTTTSTDIVVVPPSPVSTDGPTPPMPNNPDTISNPPTSSPTPPLTTPRPGGLRVMAWIYPGEPSCGASKEFTDGRKIDVLKPEFFTVNSGSLRLITSGCNAYSPAFVAQVKRASTQQFVTISSSNTTDMDTFLGSALGSDEDITTLVSFVVNNGLTGIELDFEDFGGWSADSYSNYKEFVRRLGTALHAEGKQLMLAGPAIADATEQNWFQWRYEDFVNLPVDQMVLMAYDYQFDHGVGEPVAPLDWITKVTRFASARFPASRLTVGVPTYGYEGRSGGRPQLRTYDQLKSTPGFADAPRDERSAERIWTKDGVTYVYQDTESIRRKIETIQATGISSVSVWHLGGNQWF